ncbi:tRNA (N6-threonylcarbamoyladenosine(37)-N6)-methyltransferase TrmO [Paracraurococcus ruber]|nr:tRNA (N6-threonylcarbamoyladenosine(37)-N6)-methyltransferase TrmO [Paracraurococcus ruber]
MKRIGRLGQPPAGCARTTAGAAVPSRPSAARRGIAWVIVILPVAGRIGRNHMRREAGPGDRDRGMAALAVTPIGHLETPWSTPGDCPRNGRQPDPAPECRAVVVPAFRDGLLGLEGFSHLILLYWMHRAPTPALRFTPPFDREERGIFATRAPFRPNPVALSVVRFHGFAAPGVLRVTNLDCASGTPLLDIKPYLPTTDAEPEASLGWLAPHATPRVKGSAG